MGLIFLTKKEKQKQDRNERCEKHTYEYIVKSQVSSLGKLIKTDMPQANTTEMPDVSSKEKYERRCTAKINVLQVRKQVLFDFAQIHAAPIYFSKHVC